MSNSTLVLMLNSNGLIDIGYIGEPTVWAQGWVPLWSASSWSVVGYSLERHYLRAGSLVNGSHRPFTHWLSRALLEVLLGDRYVVGPDHIRLPDICYVCRDNWGWSSCPHGRSLLQGETVQVPSRSLEGPPEGTMDLFGECHVAMDGWLPDGHRLSPLNGNKVVCKQLLRRMSLLIASDQCQYMDNIVNMFLWDYSKEEERDDCKSCLYWVGSPHLRCTVNPMGSYEGCNDYKER